MSAQRQDPELTPEILLRAYSIGLFPMAAVSYTHLTLPTNSRV